MKTACSIARVSHLTLALALLLGGCGEDAPPNSPNPLVLVAVDGADWDVLQPMLDRGELPQFRKLIDRGLKGKLMSIPPMKSPVVWTTIATGRFARAHNILDFTYPYVPGLKRPVRSTLRREPALWNIASAEDRTVGVVGYYATQPPDAVNGFMVSDTAHENLMNSVYPESLQQELEPIAEKLGTLEEEKQLLWRFLPWDYDQSSARKPEDPHYLATKAVAGRVDKRILADEFYRRVAKQLFSEQLDFSTIYLRMVDHASHSSWLYYDDSDFEEHADPTTRELLQNLIPESYRYIDEILGEILGLVGNHANIVVVSDHGSGSATGLHSMRVANLGQLTGNHRADGLFLAAGPDIRHGTIEGLTTMEVAPLLLALLDLPISRRLPGRVDEHVFRSGYLIDRPLRHVPSYRLDWKSSETGSQSQQADVEAMKTLKALGYIGAKTELANQEDGSDQIDFWNIDQMLRKSALAGEYLYYCLRHDTKSVESLAAAVRTNDPEAAAELEARARYAMERIEDSFGHPLRSCLDEDGRLAR